MDPISQPLAQPRKAAKPTPKFEPKVMGGRRQTDLRQLWPWLKKHPKIAIAVLIGLAVITAAIAIIAVKLTHKPKPAPKPPVAQAAPAAEVPPPKPVSPLTGLEVAPEVLNQPVFGVVIENSTDARPQSGLSQAGVVYETLAEGGITRFLAIYLDQQPNNLGPVRSLRPYFIDWAQEYNNPAVAHAGGSDQALAEVPQVGFKSMNGLNYGAFFHRTSDRIAPHNLYTSTDQLIALMNKYGWFTKPSFTPWKYKADAPLAQPDHPSITTVFSASPAYTAKYAFNAACDCYDRWVGGAPQIDRNTGKQIQVKNIVALTVQTDFTGDYKGHVLDATIGSGPAVVFRDGTAVVGTWKKAGRTDRTQFIDANGNEIALNAGNTWVEAIAQTGNLSY